MIIKPAADGNLLIQDRAGGAVLSTSTSGATLANGLAIGTPASGTLTNCTFPSGHIVKTSTQTTGNTRTDINVGNNNWTDTVVTASFTPTYNNSDVIVHVWYTTLIDNTGGDAGIMTRFKRNIGGTITYPASLAVAEATSSNGTRYMHIGGATVAFNWNDSTWHSLIDSPMTTSEITYTLQCAEYNCESVYIGAGNGIGSRWHIWFQEVKR